MVNYAPPAPAPRRSRRALVITALVLLALAVGLVVGRWAIPSDSGSTPAGGTPTAAGAVSGPHGPSKITQGVPSGYTRDRAGAATAAVNAVQLVVNLAHGQADPQVAARTWAAGDADQAAQEALATQPDSTADQTNKLPTTTRVTAYSDTAATVEVWVVSVGSSSSSGRTAADWSTKTVELRWESGDWKLRNLRTRQGPKPGDEDTNSTAKPAPLQNGLYTYYIN
jgi:hypothetical protein